MHNRLLHGAAFAIVALFALTLGDYLVLAQLGVRMLPVDYETLELAFFVLGALTVVVGFLVYRGPAGAGDGFFRLEVSWHRLLLAFCVPPAGMTLLGFFGGWSWFADLFAHFRLQYTGALLLGAFALGLLRRPRWAWLALAFSLVNLTVMAPQLVTWPTAEAGGDTTARFVLANVNTMNRNHEALLSFVHETDPDVLLLEEVNRRWMEEIGSLREGYPHSMATPLENNFGLGLWSRLPIVSAETVYFAYDRIPAIVATLDVGGEELLLVGAHPVPPRDASFTRYRDRELQAIADRVRTEELVVVLGDLNTTPWGHAFREFVRRSGLKDTSRGQGLQWSWPAGLWPLAIPIDHALVSERVRVLGRFMGPDIGSDHYPLVLDAGL